MSASETIMEQLKQAMRDKNEIALATLRALKSALGYKKVELCRDLEEAEEIQVFTKEANRRREAAAEYERAGRKELAEKELAQLAIIEQFLPAAMGEAEVEEKIKAIIAETGAEGKKDMGKVMKSAMAELRGRADGKLVQQLVNKLLQ